MKIWADTPDRMFHNCGKLFHWSWEETQTFRPLGEGLKVSGPTSSVCLTNTSLWFSCGEAKSLLAKSLRLPIDDGWHVMFKLVDETQFSRAQSQAAGFVTWRADSDTEVEREGRSTVQSCECMQISSSSFMTAFSSTATERRCLAPWRSDLVARFGKQSGPQKSQERRSSFLRPSLDMVQPDWRWLSCNRYIPAGWMNIILKLLGGGFDVRWWNDIG